MKLIISFTFNVSDINIESNNEKSLEKLIKNHLKLNSMIMKKHFKIRYKKILIKST